MLKTSLYVLGVVLVLVGILGFFNNPVLGIFAVDTLHNLVHIVTGLIFLWLGYAGGKTAVVGTQVFGVIYLVIAVLGFFSTDKLLGLITINMADHILHLLLAAVLLYLGFVVGKKEVGAGGGSMASANPSPASQGADNTPVPPSQ